MAQLGARGVTVFFPSGDSGVGPAGTCYTNDGRNASAFLPVFPSSCPYVTTVGGTMGFAPEVAAFDPANSYDRSFVPGNFSSGGGFSNYFSRPWYQDGIVDAYVSSLKGKYAGLYNAKGRGYPDLAAQSVSVATVWNGSLVHIDGTKCGITTAVFSLVNDARIAAGKPPMGFLNPWLYKRGAAAMHDILSGSAVGCGVNGFPAQKGWDAVTGFGSPMFKEILKLLP
jgi:tripeptidyl-peptidase-1